MKKIFIVLFSLVALMLTSCSANALAAYNQEREAANAKYQSEYAVTINKLEMKESNFDTYRRVVFYNVRNDVVVWVCEGYCHVKIDSDGDVELVIKTGANEYLRHYLGKQPDCTYFSEQLKPVGNVDTYSYHIVFNPNLWLPRFAND